MSDKFFFKGRQDVRENHVTTGYKTKAAVRAGTKKQPLSLVVTNEQRQKEIEALLAEENIYADIELDFSEGALESTEALTALLNKRGTIRFDKVPARNEPCLCGSGKKYKKCCG